MTERRPHPVVDVDAHYYEDVRGFSRYLDEPWKSRFANWSGQFYMPVAGAAIYTGDARLQGRIRHHLYPLPRSAADVPEVMRFLGVDVIVLLPDSMLTIAQVTDKRRAVAICNGFIDSMLDGVVDPAAGIYTVVCPPPQDPAAGAELIRRVGREPGVAGVCLMTDGPILPYGDSYYDPIYRAAVDHGLPVLFHGGFGGPEGSDSGYRLQTYAENHLAFVLNNQIQLTSVVFQGVAERFPDLKIVFEEAGVFWIPQMMFRLDTEYSMRRSELTLLRQPPSAYIKRFFFGTQPLERVPTNRYLQYVFEMIEGENCLMFATDWPHHDFDNPVTIRRLSFLPEAARDRILGGNACRVMRFQPVGVLAPGA